MNHQIQTPEPMGPIRFHYDGPQDILFAFCEACLKTQPMPHPLAPSVAEATGSKWGRRRRLKKAKKAERKARKRLKWQHFTCAMR